MNESREQAFKDKKAAEETTNKFILDAQQHRKPNVTAAVRPTPPAMSQSSPESSLMSSSSSASSAKDVRINGRGDELHEWDGDDESGGNCGGDSGSPLPSTLTKTLSQLDSLDCWDYTIELACLTGGPKDLQLAAELGKTLLERNKELEANLKQQQIVIEDREQEIEYLRKQSAALREVNDSRLRIYENLEVSIHDIEKSNIRLLNEGTSQKKSIKTLTAANEALEAKHEELNKQIADLNREKTALQRQHDKLTSDRSEHATKSAPKTNHLPNSSAAPIQRSFDNFSGNISTSSANSSACALESIPFRSLSTSFASSSVNGEDQVDGGSESMGCDEEYANVLTELNATRRQCKEEQQRVNDLEEQLNALIQENQELANRIQSAVVADEMKSMHDELSVLDEARYGKLCSRCMRSCNDAKMHDDDISCIGTEDGDDNSMLEMNSIDAGPYANSVDHNMRPNESECSYGDHAPSPNPYRELVEKYEALLEVQRQPIPRNRMLVKSSLATTSIPPSTVGFQPDEHSLNSADFNSLNATDQHSSAASTTSAQDNHHHHNRSNLNSVTDSSGASSSKTPHLRTPTDFSEAETSSSGFADETSNKHTQTDEALVCTIADGEDKFSIYDDACTIDGHFGTRPQYRELFKEIFTILKKAAVNKDEGEKLPLLDQEEPDQDDVDSDTLAADPVATELNADGTPDVFIDDTESVVSSIVSEKSVAMSERITKHERKTILDTVKKHCEKTLLDRKPLLLPGNSSTLVVDKDGRVLTPLKRDHLEYLSVSVNVRKKNRKKARGTAADRSDSPVLPSPPRVFFTSSGKKRRDMRSTTIASAAAQVAAARVNKDSPPTPKSPLVKWDGTSMTVYNRNYVRPDMSPSSASGASFSQNSPNTGASMLPHRPDLKRNLSMASQNLQKLMELDLSYAEVLRRADTNKRQFKLQ